MFSRQANITCSYYGRACCIKRKILFSNVLKQASVVVSLIESRDFRDAYVLYKWTENRQTIFIRAQRPSFEELMGNPLHFTKFVSDHGNVFTLQEREQIL